MELNQFVKSTLNQILDSVESVNNERGGHVLSFKTNKDGKWSFGAIDFDVAVIVDKDVEAEGSLKGGVGIKVFEAIDIASVRGDLKSKERNTTSNVSRIKFSVGIDHNFLEEPTHEAVTVSEADFRVYD